MSQAQSHQQGSMDATSLNHREPLLSPCLGTMYQISVTLSRQCKADGVSSAPLCLKDTAQEALYSLLFTLFASCSSTARCQLEQKCCWTEGDNQFFVVYITVNIFSSNKTGLDWTFREISSLKGWLNIEMGFPESLSLEVFKKPCRCSA